MSENVLKRNSLETETLDENTLFVPVKIDETESEHIASEPYSYWKSVFRVFIKKPAAIVALVSLALFLLAIIIIPAIAPDWAYSTHVTDSQLAATGVTKNMAPSWFQWVEITAADGTTTSVLRWHLFGTDQIGRDLFYSCFAGAQKSIILGLISSAIVIVIGTLAGLAWGYFRRLDPIFIEIYNLISNIPSLLLYMLLATILKEAFPEMIAEVRLVISLTILGWVGISLTIRNLVLIISNREYNVASITLGTPPMRIMIKNFLPFLMGVIITDISLLIPGMISSEVSMSYFGLGLDTQALSIGAILNLGISMFDQYPWQLLAPGGVLAWIIFTFFLLGTTLSDALDPKTHR
jgi:oligopeptide transport system permease protein